MTDKAARLRLAREAAGFENAREAADRFGWAYPTYSSHENGSRGIRADKITEYAQAFRVAPAWLLSGDGPMAAPKGNAEGTAKRASGFGEAEIAPFIPASASAAKLVENLAAALAAGSRHIQTFTAQRDYAGYAVLKGDLLIIGTPRKETEGDLVIATLTDTNDGTSMTVLRQRMGDRLVPPIQARIEDEDKLSAGILGTVISVVRSPGLA
ncbi:helix-turn-helix domain-containing protein [Pseudotabrizicola algicola]|uniref:Helix-turn-helix transcriptional regulator n=1 Tax=Pseudotabrizicola algicola TaxID=2709381 RepID=A0A6B3RJ41_9RHOB|nr:helix-turn-helix transcriptional regulator [Pseudotabrizicola algicola]NEX45206.1 helix-turn-helix transcriptional regulator [Pseudotabrizicola algicola]